MNRTFLIILMIGTAMMIAVIGQHEPATQLDTMPWEVDRLENGSLRVFGLTLGKTSIQDANQIFASFAETRLQVSTDSNHYQTHQLIAIYNDLNIGGLVAQIKLNYMVDSDDLQDIDSYLKTTQAVKNSSKDLKAGIELYSVSKETEMKHLNKPVSSITYTPSIDYGLESIRQNFGLASDEKQIDEDLQLWSYPEMGLNIFISKSMPDRFVYAPLVIQNSQ